MDLGQLMNPKLTALAVAVILTVAVFARLYVQRRRRSTTAEMRQRFGPEYERAVGEQGPERRAEAQLAAREKRVEQLKIHDLDSAKRELFAGQWQVLQSRFVDDPKAAVTEADALVSTFMQARGYPVADFPQLPRIFPSTIPEWWRITGLRTRLSYDSGKGKPVQRICEPR
jgi:hypothetical protein